MGCSQMLSLRRRHVTRELDRAMWKTMEISRGEDFRKRDQEQRPVSVFPSKLLH